MESDKHNHTKLTSEQDDAEEMVTEGYESTLEDSNSGFSWEGPVPSSSPRPVKPLYEEEPLINRLINPLTGGALVLGLIFGFGLRGCFIEDPGTKMQTSDIVQKSTTAPTVESSASAPLETVPPAEETPIETPEIEPTPPPTKVATKKISVPQVNAKGNARSSGASKKAVRSVTFGSKGSFAQVRINTGKQKFKYRSQVIKRPYRLVLDLTGINSTKTKSKIIAPKSSRPIKSVRLSRQNSNKLRIVLDLATQSTPRYTIGRNANGLTVSVRK